MFPLVCGRPRLAALQSLYAVLAAGDRCFNVPEWHHACSVVQHRLWDPMLPTEKVLAVFRKGWVIYLPWMQIVA